MNYLHSMTTTHDYQKNRNSSSKAIQLSCSLTWISEKVYSFFYLKRFISGNLIDYKLNLR